MATVVLAFGTALPTYAGGPADAGPYRVQMVHRTGTSLAPFDITVSATSDNDYGMVFGIELVRTAGRWNERVAGFGGYLEIAPSLFPVTYGTPVSDSAPTCPDAPGCRVPTPYSGSVTYRVRPTSTSRFYVVSSNADVTIGLSRAGWQVRDVRSPGVRRAVTRSTSAVGARAGAVAVERFTAASLPGGRYGSSVVAYIPCDYGGYGEATLSGRGATVGDGVRPGRLTCAGRSSYHYEYARTPYQTTWRLDGDVVGAGSLLVRLFVFDFPKP